MLGRVHQQSYIGGHAGATQQAFLRTNNNISKSDLDLSSVEDLEVFTSNNTRSESSLTSSSDVVVVATDKTSKFDQLHAVRYKLEHNQLSRSTSEYADKIQVFKVSQIYSRVPDNRTGTMFI